MNEGIRRGPGEGGEGDSAQQIILNLQTAEGVSCSRVFFFTS